MKYLWLPVCLLLFSCAWGRGPQLSQTAPPIHSIQPSGGQMQVTSLSVSDIKTLTMTADSLLMINEKGQLLRLHTDMNAEVIAQDLSSLYKPVSHGSAIAVVTRSGHLALWKDGQVNVSSWSVSPHSSLLFQDDRITFISQEGVLTVVNTSWEKQAARTDFKPLPDAQLLRAHGKLAVLAGPSARYAHGVLGDNIEATELRLLDPVTLRDAMNPFVLEGNKVFEANAIQTFAQTERWVAVVSGDGAGARIAVFEPKGTHLQMRTAEALSSNRWQSPIIFQETLYSVQMPHILGRFVRYDEQLQPTTITEGVSNHHIGMHQTDISGIVNKEKESILLLPRLDGTGLTAFNPDGTLHQVSLTQNVKDAAGPYVLLDDGSVVKITQP